MIHKNLYIKPQPDHWMFDNRKLWSADEVTDFIKEHCKRDVIRPCGPRLLIWEPIPSEKKTSGGIIVPVLIDEDRVKSTSVAKVLDFGPDAYQDSVKFPSGPYCQRGDWVFYYKYERRSIELKIPLPDDLKYSGYESISLFTCFDDKVLCVVEDPIYINGTKIA